MGLKLKSVNIGIDLQLFSVDLLFENEDKKDFKENITKHKTKESAEKAAIQWGKIKKCPVYDDKGQKIADFSAFDEPMGMA